MKFAIHLVAIGLSVAAAGRAYAQEVDATDDPNVPQTIELTVSSAAEPRPALKYRLLPAPSERTPGNAATYYYRAILSMNNIPKDRWKQYDERSQEWLSSDSKVFPKEPVAQWLGGSSWHYDLRTAAYREYCEWDYRLQDLRGMETIAFLLSEVQECRQLARLVQLKAHLEIMEGRTDDAFQTLRLGYQLAHDVAQEPLLINALVGIAIAETMNQELLVLIEHSSANYYWALATLPQPLVDLRPAMQYEMNMPYQLFPLLKDAETANHSAEEWRRMVVEFIQAIPLMESNGGSGISTSGWQGELVAAMMVARMYPVAKEALIADGMDRERVEAMPVGQVVAIQTARGVEYAYQEVFKVALLPYEEASQRLPVVLARLTEEGYMRPGMMSGKSGLPIAAILLPAVSQVLHAEARAARNRAAIQAIEAIRMHAAGAGKLPASLAEVMVVPIPKNPATGQPFAYSLDAATGTATLEMPPVGGLQPRHDGRRYRIRLNAAAR